MITGTPDLETIISGYLGDPRDVHAAIQGFRVKDAKEWFRGQLQSRYADKQVKWIMDLVPKLLVGTPPALHSEEYSGRKWILLTKILTHKKNLLLFKKAPIINQVPFYAFGIAVDPGEGEIYVTGQYNHHLQVFSKTGEPTRFIRGMDPFKQSKRVAVDQGEDGCVWVSDGGNHRVQVFTKEGRFLHTIGGGGALRSPMGVCVEHGESGEVYVADMGNNRVQVFTKTGEYKRSFTVGAAPFGRVIGVAVAGGLLFVLDKENHSVEIFYKTSNQNGNQAGAHIHTICGNGDGNENTQFSFPTDVAVGSGPNGRLYVLDHGNERIQVFTKGGAYLRTIGSGMIKDGRGIAVGERGRVYVTMPYQYNVMVLLDLERKV